MYWIAVGALMVGLVALLLGYRKNNRNILAVAAVLLLLAGSVEDVVKGFQDGVSDSQAKTSGGPTGRA